MSDAPVRLTVGVPRETCAGETRVALSPAVLGELGRSGVQVLIETGAGSRAGFSDDAYAEKGAEIVADRRALFDRAALIAQVRAAAANPSGEGADRPLWRQGQALVALCDPLAGAEIVSRLAARGVTVFALELLPRITRAQAMDVLSSMATVAGYKAVLLAANVLPRMFPLLMTAAGTVNPARVFVVGAGVAGLQAIATAHRLGAVVTAYDVRAAVKDEVKSVGGRFLELPLDVEGAEAAGGYARAMDESFYRRQQEMMLQAVGASDVVITTAVVQGKPAPKLVTAEMVERMQAGSVIVDLAAERGGNCELTRPGETANHNGVTILGPTNLPATVPYHASQLFAKNVSAFIRHVVKDGALRPDPNDPIVKETLVSRGGEVVHPRVREQLGMSFTLTSDVGGF